MLQVKFDFRLILIQPNSLCLLTLIIHELGLGNKLKEIENQPILNQN